MSAGAGYDINASLANSETSSLPVNLGSPTYFVFGSQADFGDFGQTASPVQPATATASAAKGGNANAQSSGSGVDVGSSSISGHTILYVGLGLGAGLLAYFAVRKFT